MHDDDNFVVEADWSKPDLPRLIGPFDTRSEATDWAERNVMGGTWRIAQLAYPYMRSKPGDAK